MLLPFLIRVLNHGKAVVMTEIGAESSLCPAKLRCSCGVREDASPNVECSTHIKEPMSKAVKRFTFRVKTSEEALTNASLQSRYPKVGKTPAMNSWHICLH